MSTAFDIYMHENSSGRSRKFRNDATRYFQNFITLFGDLYLDELRHWHITRYRDIQLQAGLHPNSVRKHNNLLNAMLNMAFKHLSIDRLSPFRGLRIAGEGEPSRPMPVVNSSILMEIKQHLSKHATPARLIGLIQLNTGLRISEPALARLEDLVLDHPIPHIWVRKNTLTQRKTRQSIRSVPLLGISLEAAYILHDRAKRRGSTWLVPEYAREQGAYSCSATLNKHLRSFDFRSHMFRHAFIDRLKASNNIPLPLAESITGHGTTRSDFAMYGTVGYTLEQKLQVIREVLI